MGGCGAVAPRDTVYGADRGSLLFQAYTNGNGHCSFTGPQIVTAVNAVASWVETGTAPTAATFPSALGFVPGFVPPPMNQPYPAEALAGRPHRSHARIASLSIVSTRARLARHPAGLGSLAARLYLSATSKQRVMPVMSTTCGAERGRDLSKQA